MNARRKRRRDLERWREGKLRHSIGRGARIYRNLGQPGAEPGGPWEELHNVRDITRPTMTEQQWLTALLRNCHLIRNSTAKSRQPALA